jgi:tartrate dehydrogenase/decarboxylase/D-malate dehydrogenase
MNMKQFRIALYPGDGIGKDVTDEVVRVLEHVQTQSNDFKFAFTQFDWGCDYYDQHGIPAPEDHLEQLRPFDAIYLGALGFPSRVPDHITLVPIIQMRQQFDQYACVRPAKTYRGVRTPLADAGDIDMVVVRENSEGEYFSSGGRFKIGTPDEVAMQTAIHTRKGIERILRFSFELARKRRKHLTMITKSNAMKFGYVLWDEILELVSGDYPDVSTDKLHIDAATINFVRRPSAFDVVVASNLFGDILTDLSGAITGSLGLNPSANLDPSRTSPSLFEPVHGSAPDIAGQGIANPVAAILAAAMMLDWLDLAGPAAAITAAVDKALTDGCATPDLGGDLTTVQMTDRIVERIEC